MCAIITLSFLIILLFFLRVESFIQHQDTCTIRVPQPTSNHRPLQQNIEGHATTSRSPSVGPLLHGLPLLRPPQASHQQSLASACPFENLQLQLSIGMTKTEVKRNETSLTMERAIEEASRADKMRQEARRQIEMAEVDFDKAKNIRKEAKAEVERAQIIREEAIKRINATMLEITCHSCKKLFQLPVVADESTSSLVSCYVSTATTEGECE